MAAGSKNSRQFRGIFGESIPFTATVDFASAADAETQASSDLSVPGAALGDFVMVSLGVDAADLTVDSRVTAADTVVVTVNNNTGGAVDLASTTVRGVVLKPGQAFEGL